MKNLELDIIERKNYKTPNNFTGGYSTTPLPHYVQLIQPQHHSYQQDYPFSLDFVRIKPILLRWWNW